MDATSPTQIVTNDELVEAIICELGRYGLNDPRGIERRPILRVDGVPFVVAEFIPHDSPPSLGA